MENTNFIVVKMTAELSNFSARVSCEVQNGLYPEFSNMNNEVKMHWESRYNEFIKTMNKFEGFDLHNIHIVVAVYNRPSFTIDRVLREYKIIPKGPSYVSARGFNGRFNFEPLKPRKTPLKKIILKDWSEAMEIAIEEFKKLKDEYMKNVDNKTNTNTHPLSGTGGNMFTNY